MPFKGFLISVSNPFLLKTGSFYFVGRKHRRSSSEFRDAQAQAPAG